MRSPGGARRWAVRGGRRIDPLAGPRVPFGGRSRSTGAACPWGLNPTCGRAVPVDLRAGSRLARHHARATRFRPSIHAPASGVNNVEQAHLPAEQPSSAQDPWLPPAHAHACRSVDPVVSSPQGSRPPRRLRRASAGVLAAPNRLTAPADFTRVVRRGVRSGGPLLVLHLLVPNDQVAQQPARVGLVVGRGVGPAVTRTLVKRRLRHLARERLEELPPGSLAVLRAQPAAASASYAELGAAFDRSLHRCRDDLTGGRRRGTGAGAEGGSQGVPGATAGPAPAVQPQGAHL